MQIDHRFLDDVRRCSLHRHVDRHPFSGFPHLAVGRVNILNHALPAENRLHITGLACLFFGQFEVFSDARVFFKIGSDEFAGVRAR